MDTKIRNIFWGVHPQASRGATRPEHLVRELEARGVISHQASKRFHGLKQVSGKMNFDGFVPVGQNFATRQAILSPVFASSFGRDTIWIDLYDDWSLAPDIHIYYRALAAAGFRNVRNGRFDRAVVTVNSLYLADKLLPRKVDVIPNGVEAQLASKEMRGSTKRQLVVLGKFFRGRTDFALLERLARRPEFESVHIGAPGKSREMRKTLMKLRAALGPRLSVYEWIDDKTIARIAGPRTVALIPNMVRDYTISQDPMKAYEFMALGIKVICPRLLWPESLERTFVYLVDHGANLDSTLGPWIDSAGPSRRWREEFVGNCSWRVRAADIAKLIEGKRRDGC